MNQACEFGYIVGYQTCGRQKRHGNEKIEVEGLADAAGISHAVHSLTPVKWPGEPAPEIFVVFVTPLVSPLNPPMVVVYQLDHFSENKVNSAQPPKFGRFDSKTVCRTVTSAGGVKTDLEISVIDPQIG